MSPQLMHSSPDTPWKLKPCDLHIISDGRMFVVKDTCSFERRDKSPDELCGFVAAPGVHVWSGVPPQLRWPYSGSGLPWKMDATWFLIEFILCSRSHFCSFDSVLLLKVTTADLRI